MLISPAYAQAASTAAQPDGFTAFMVNFFPLILIFIVFWFLIFRPQQKRRLWLPRLKIPDKLWTSTRVGRTPQ